MREYRILHLEDSRSDSDLVKRQLQKGNMKFQYFFAEDRESFMRGLAEFKPDIILCDHALPQFDSHAALEIYKEINLEIPFILVTGSVSEEYAVEMIKKGIDDYILKTNLHRLTLAIEGAVHKRDNERQVREGILKLEQNEFRMREAQRIAHLGNWEMDFITDVVLWSEETCAIFGLPPEENVQTLTSWLSYIHPDDVEHVTKVINESYKALCDGMLHHRIILKNGEIKYIYSENKFKFDTNGKPIGMYGIAQDVTAYKVVEENLKKSEEQFRLISENVADMIAVLDLDGRRLYVSPSYKTLFGDLQSLLGTDSFLTIHPEDRGKVREIFRSTIKTGISYRTEYRILIQNKNIYTIEAHGSVIRNDQGDITQVVVVSRDITEKKQFENQFLRMQRMESIGTLASGIAHDLNNVLAPILLSVNFLSMKVTDEPSIKMLQMLEASTKRGSELIKQVLSFARGVEGEFTMVQIRHIIEEIGKIVAQTFPKSIEMRTKFRTSLPSIMADATQLHQVLMNLCVNARDAMPNGGLLEIEAETVELDEQYMRMHIEAQLGSYLVITVSDQGMGIAPGILERIFEPFFTTKEIGKGTGLGLSTVLTIIKSHKGFVNVYSEVGKGTTFKLYLPIQQDGNQYIEGVEKEIYPDSNGELILIVEDEVSIREITKITLQAHGYTVLTAVDGTEALAIYAHYGDDIALVITDMMMPYMDGTATIRAIQKMNPFVKIIAVSGLKQDNEIVNQERVVFLHKPYTSEKLLSIIGEILERN